jgi:hypothetical protein
MFPIKVFNFLKIVEFKYDDLKMFISTFLCDNVDDYDFLKLKNVLGHWIFTWAKCFFNHLTK